MKVCREQWSALARHFPKSPLSPWLFPMDSKFKKKALGQVENSNEHVLACVLYARGDLVLYVS